MGRRYIDFEWAEDLSIYTKNAIKNYHKNSNIGCILEIDIEYPKQLWKHHKDLSFWADRKILDNTGKLVTAIEDKEKYVIHISAIKQALNHGLKLKKIHRVIEFREETWLNLCIDMNAWLRMQAKNDFEKDFFKLMNNSVFGKTMENLRNHQNIKLLTNNERRNNLVSEPNYHTTKYFSENLLAIEMRKTKIIINKPVYLGQAILDNSKTLMYEFWDDYIKPKYQEKAQLCYMDTNSFIIDIKTEDFHEDISYDVNKWFDTSDYDKTEKKPLPIGRNKKVIGMFKDELNGKIMKEFCALRAKTYAFLLDETEKKKPREQRKRKIAFENYKNCLFNDKIALKS